MLLAPSFSPKVQRVLDCLFNTVRALAGRTCPSTSRSFASSVVLAMPGKARVAALAPKLLVHPRAHTLPAQKRGTAHSMPMDLSPGLCWTWAGMRTCRSPCPSLFQLPLAAFWAAVGCCARPSWAWWGAGGAALLGPGSVLEHRHWQLCAGPSHSELTTTDTSGKHMGQAVAELFGQGHVFSIFSIAPSAVNKHHPQSIYHLTELKTYTKIDHLNRLWFLQK